MKRILSLTFALAIGIAMAFAAGNNKQIERIRAIYNDVHEHIAMAEEEPMMTNQMTIDINQMYPGSGPHKEHITFYFTCLDFSEEDQREDGSINWQSDLQFVTQSFNIGAHEYYCEYLYDPETGEPLFALITFDDDETGQKQSVRYYFDKGKLIQTIPAKVSDEWPTDVNDRLYNFKHLQEIFKKVVLGNSLI